MPVSFAQQRAIDAALAEYERIRTAGANPADLAFAADRVSALINTPEAGAYANDRYQAQEYGVAPDGSRPDLSPEPGAGTPNPPAPTPTTPAPTPPTTTPTTPAKGEPNPRSTIPGGTTAGGGQVPIAPPVPGPRSGPTVHWNAAPEYAKLMISTLWPEGEWDRAASIPPLESGWNAAAWNQNGEDSRGWWQINVSPQANYDLRTLVGDLTVNNEFDPTRNTLAAFIVWYRQGWRAWSTYTAAGISSGAAKPGRDVYGDLSIPFLEDFQAQMGARDYPPFSSAGGGDGGPSIGDIVNGLGDFLGGSLDGILDGLVQSAAATVGAIGDVTGEVLDAVQEAAVAAINAVGPTIEDIAGGALAAVARVANTLDDALDPVTGIGGAIAGGLVDGLGMVLGPLGGAIVGGAEAAIRLGVEGATDALQRADFVPQVSRPARFGVRAGV